MPGHHCCQEGEDILFHQQICHWSRHSDHRGWRQLPLCMSFSVGIREFRYHRRLSDVLIWLRLSTSICVDNNCITIAIVIFGLQAFMAEWSKAVRSGRILSWRGFESHWMHKNFCLADGESLFLLLATCSKLQAIATPEKCNFFVNYFFFATEHKKKQKIGAKVLSHRQFLQILSSLLVIKVGYHIMFASQ